MHITLQIGDVFVARIGALRSKDQGYKNICNILGIKQPIRAVENFPENEKAEVSINHLSSNGVMQKRKVLIVNEPGLYRLIFQSRKPEAEAFKTWIFNEVIPSIRKKGF